jgi:hypothetical protein
MMITNDKARFMLYSITEQFHTPIRVLSRELKIERTMLSRFLNGNLELSDDKLESVELYLQSKSLLRYE